MHHKLTYFIYPAFSLAIEIEIFLVRGSRKQIFSWQESLNSLGIFLIHHLTQISIRAHQNVIFCLAASVIYHADR